MKEQTRVNFQISGHSTAHVCALMDLYVRVFVLMSRPAVHLRMLVTSCYGMEPHKFYLVHYWESTSFLSGADRTNVSEVSNRE